MWKTDVFKKIKRLLKKGADPNSQDSEGATPLFYYLSDDIYEDDFKVLEEYSSEEHYFDFYSDYDIYEDPYYSDENDFTPLHYQCQYHSFEMLGNNRKESLRTLKLLIKYGGNMNLPSNCGCTPLIKGLQMCSSWSTGWFIDFLLEYSDLAPGTSSRNSIGDIDTFLLKSYDMEVTCEYPVFTWKKFIEHVVKLNSIDVSTVDSSVFQTIDEYEVFSGYLDECREELKELKNTKIAEDSWINCYDLLVNSRRKLKNYMANEAVNVDRIKKWKKEFPIYGSTIEKKVLSAQTRRKYLEESARLLSECLPIFNPMHLVIRDTLDCIMRKKDLFKFIQGGKPYLLRIRKRKQNYATGPANKIQKK